MLSFDQARKAARHERHYRDRPRHRHRPTERERPGARTSAQRAARDFVRAVGAALAETTMRSGHVILVTDEIMHGLIPLIADKVGVRSRFCRRGNDGLCPAVLYAYGRGPWTSGIHGEPGERDLAALRSRKDKRRIRKIVGTYREMVETLRKEFEAASKK